MGWEEGKSRARDRRRDKKTDALAADQPMRWAESRGSRGPDDDKARTSGEDKGEAKGERERRQPSNSGQRRPQLLHPGL